MTRKTLTIKNKELAQYISNTSKSLGQSQARFIEDRLLENMATYHPEHDSLSKIQNIATKLRTTVMNSEAGAMNQSASRLQIKETIIIPIPKITINKQKSTDRIELNIKNLVLEGQTEAMNDGIVNDKLASLYEDIAHYTNKKTIDENHQKNKICIIPLLFINVDKITIKDMPKNQELLDILKELRANTLKKVQSEILIKDPNISLRRKLESINEIYTEMEKYISNLLESNPALLKVDYSGWFTVISLHEELNNQFGYFDFLNIKYKRYNDIKENSVNERERLLCLLKGKYGYLYCDVFRSPQKTSSIIQQYDDLKSKDKKNKNKHINLIVNNDYFVNIINEPPRRKNESLLIREILSIYNQKIKIRENIKFNINFDENLD